MPVRYGRQGETGRPLRRRGLLYPSALFFSVVWLCLVVPTFVPLAAQAAPIAARIDVPAQPLSRALTAVADRAGVEVIFRGEEVAGHRSRAVKGALSPGDALSRAAGPDFTVLSAGPNTFVLRRKPQPAPVKAVARPVSPRSEAPQKPETIDTIIVTARPGIRPRTRVESSYAVTRLSSEDVRLSGGSSTADLLRMAPGLWVEASGGEASNNVRARGIPRDGYASLAIYEDGLPVQHDAGLGYLNADQSFRVDESAEALEIVRGGTAPVFASNAVGGLVNLITRAPPETPEGRIKLQAGNGGLVRLDGWGGAPVGEWRLAAGGFYRRDGGLRDTGFTANRGGQVRLTAVRNLGDGHLRVDYKHIDDRVAFYLPVPLTLLKTGGIAEIPGFDPHKDTLTGPDGADVVLHDANGAVYPFDLTRGTEVRLDQLTLDWTRDLGERASLRHSLRHRHSETWRNALFPGFPDTAANKLTPYLEAARRIHPATARLGLVYTVDGEAFDTANGLAIDATYSSVRIPLRETVSDNRLQQALTLWGQPHDLTLGVYAAQVEMGMQRLTATGLTEVAPRARRLDIAAYDAAGNALGLVTRGGITRDGAQFDNYSGEEILLAVYGADEWRFGELWRADIGVRLESLHIRLSSEGSAVRKGNDATIIGDDEVLGGTGVFVRQAWRFTSATASAGLSRQMAEGQAYLRLTRTERLPNLSDLTMKTADAIRKEPVWLGEIGLKRSAADYDLHLAGFVTAFSGYRVTDNVYDAVSHSYVAKSAFSDTLSYGAEIEALWRPVERYDVAISATVQKARFDTLIYTELVDGKPVRRDFSHNRLVRVPELMARVTLGRSFRDGRIEVGAEHFGDRYADAANSLRLPAYTTLRAALRLRLSPQVTLYATGDNLTDALGLTEGNPRAGQFVSSDAEAAWLAARPILGRSLRLSLLYTF